MSDAVNPYQAWLGVPAEVTAPNHYELLGLRLLEHDREVIHAAAGRRVRQLEPLLPGAHGLLACRILGEIATAEACLLDPQAKALYDQPFRPPVAGPASDQPLPAFLPPPAPEQPLAGSGSPPWAASPLSLDRASGRTAGPRRRHPRFTGGSPQPPWPADRLAPAPRSATVPSAAPPPELQSLDEDPDALSVPMVGKMELEAVLDELTQVMTHCRELYLSCVARHDEAELDVPRQIAISLDQLHRCLLVKICATIGEADGRWSYEEQRCAAAVLQHVGVPFAAERLEETAGSIARQAAQVAWEPLLRPFHEFPEAARQNGRIGDGGHARGESDRESRWFGLAAGDARAAADAGGPSFDLAAAGRGAAATLAGRHRRDPERFRKTLAARGGGAQPTAPPR